MARPVPSEKFAQAIAEFNQHAHRNDGADVVPCLAVGLSLIRNSLYPRLHQDPRLKRCALRSASTSADGIHSEQYPSGKRHS